MKNTTITLPYPPSGLSPNARLFWAAKRRTARSYELDCDTRLCKWRATLKGATQFRFTFAPPDKKRRDVDNVIASMKGCIDVLSRYSGIDDSKFKIDWPREFHPPVKNGAVYVEVIA